MVVLLRGFGTISVCCCVRVAVKRGFDRQNSTSKGQVSSLQPFQLYAGLNGADLMARFKTTIIVKMDKFHSLSPPEICYAAVLTGANGYSKKDDPESLSELDDSDCAKLSLEITWGTEEETACHVDMDLPVECRVFVQECWCFVAW